MISPALPAGVPVGSLVLSLQQEIRQHTFRQRWAQNKVTERRQQAARARKYYQDYRVQLRAKLLRARTRQEKVRMDEGSCSAGVEFFPVRTPVLRAGSSVLQVQKSTEPG